MQLSNQLLFFFSALGAFNGILLGIYFIVYARPKKIANYFLGVLLLSLSIRIGKSIFYYFNPELAKIYLQIGLSACFLIGPSLFFYVKSMLNNGATKIYWGYHFTPILLLIILMGILYPYETYPRPWQTYIFKIIYLQWLLYIIATGYILRHTFYSFLKNTRKSIDIWIISIYIGNILIWVAYNTTSYTSYIAGALSFSFIIYLFLLLTFFYRKKQSVITRSPSIKYADKKINNKEASILLEKLACLMTEEQLYKDANLKLPEVAKKLHIIPHKLSQLINDNAEKSFSSYINEYRIKEATHLLEHQPKLTIEAIGYECGFNSKSTFYATFKKITGMTPASFRKNLAP
ncbi:helix-turn-helix domain-containing protein [Aquimarina hainanensis]|uniref:Helix-turn-helix domain-containing protein n=1 Tax=Aquimarina hainanensis TaxID=1578017 RepID=A0ABW5N6X2_9FLAO